MDTSKDAKGVVSTAKQSPRPGGHSGKGGLMAAVGPISYLHGYTNAQGGTLPDCGQAAISTALDAWQYNPYSLDRTTQDSADSQYYWDNDTIVEAVENQYPNRVVPFFNNQVGMFPEDIMAALQALSGGNCHLERCYSGAFGIGWESNWAMLQSRMQSGCGRTGIWLAGRPLGGCLQLRPVSGCLYHQFPDRQCLDPGSDIPGCVVL